MSIDNSDAPGFPAPQTRVRSVPTELSGMPQPNRPAHNSKPPVGEHGWLTPIRPSASGGGLYLWRCRCDRVVLKRANDVRKHTKAGRAQACDECAKMLREARMRREP